LQIPFQRAVLDAQIGNLISAHPHLRFPTCQVGIDQNVTCVNQPVTFEDSGSENGMIDASMTSRYGGSMNATCLQAVGVVAPSLTGP
jgi:hypothetical protein